MPSKSVERKRKQLTALFLEQEGLCHWCKRDMWLSFCKPPGCEPEFALRATIEHLDDRLSGMRGKHPPNARRRVAACHECNSRRGAEALAALPIEEIRARSMRRKSDKDADGAQC